MLDKLLFPVESHVTIQQIDGSESLITISIYSENKSGVCPGCGVENDRVHSAYQRHPKDLPCMGQAVQLQAKVRRFFCDNKGCERVTFAEQFRCLLSPKARRTQRLKQQHREIAFELGGEAGKQVCRVTGMPISGDTLIRAIRQSPEQAVRTPCVLGIDDWAKRKGQAYGTILVDLETHEPIDLLSSRTAEVVTTWLNAHPGVQIVSRDRGGEYIKGVNDGAAEIEQVADRWHLLSNLREALVAVLEKKPDALKAAAQVAMEETIPSPIPNGQVEGSPLNVTTPELAKTLPTKEQQNKGARNAKRQARFEQVHALRKEGQSIRTIARQLNMGRRAVTRYLNAESCPQYPEGRVRSSKLSPYLKSLQTHWQAGCTSASQLWGKIQHEGFDGSRGLVARWAAKERMRLPAELRYRRQQATDFPASLPPPLPIIPWSAKRASWLIVKKSPDLDEEEKNALMRMIQSDAQVAHTVELARQFITMIRHRQEDKLDAWLEKVKTSHIPALISFANGLQKDLAAVRNALHYPWSNGQTEGQVNRLKFIKRQMYGRAKFDLLRRRVLHRRTPIGTVG